MGYGQTTQQTHQKDNGAAIQGAFGALEIGVGVPLALVPAAGAALTIVPGAAIGEIQLAVCGLGIYGGITLTADGCNRISSQFGGMQIDLNWLGLPQW